MNLQLYKNNMRLRDSIVQMLIELRTYCCGFLLCQYAYYLLSVYSQCLEKTTIENFLLCLVPFPESWKLSRETVEARAECNYAKMR